MVLNMNILLWLGILLCLIQSAMFSGLTIGFFGLSRLRLEVETATKDPAAFKILVEFWSLSGRDSDFNDKLQKVYSEFLKLQILLIDYHKF